MVGELKKAMAGNCCKICTVFHKNTQIREIWHMELNIFTALEIYLYIVKDQMKKILCSWK